MKGGIFVPRMSVQRLKKDLTTIEYASIKTNILVLEDPVGIPAGKILSSFKLTTKH